MATVGCICPLKRRQIANRLRAYYRLAQGNFDVSGGYFRNWWVPMTSTRRTDNAQAILAAPRSRILHRCRAAPERRPRASERDPRAKNPFLTPTAPLSASRQPSSRPPCVFHGRLAESCARREGRRQRREIGFNNDMGSGRSPNPGVWNHTPPHPRPRVGQYGDVWKTSKWS